MLFFAPPLEDTSDGAFRTLCYRHGADATFTEMTRLAGLVKNNKATWEKVKLLDNTPTYIQLLVSKEREVEKFLETFKPPASFVGFNLNMGCPSPDVIQLGLGCAHIKRIQKTNRIIALFKKYRYSISIKLRLGMNAYEKERKVYLNLLKETDADFYIVHARHGRQVYDEPADFSVYPECVATGKKIIANGDIRTTEQVRYLQSIGVAGVMIGRAAVRDARIFERIKQELGLSTYTPTLVEELRAEYNSLATAHHSRAKYTSNVLKRLGKQYEEQQLI